MKPVFMQLMMSAALVFLTTAAQAAITCSAITSSGFSSAYVPSTAAMNITQSSFTMTCQRNAGGDATTVSYGVRNDNGIQETGNQNRARMGATANYMNYDVWANSGCSVTWRNNAANDIVDTIPVLTGFTPASKTTSFWGCIPGSQAVAAGTYTDTVVMTARLGAGGTGAILATGSFPVSIVTPSSCSISTAPGNVAFGTYTALGATVSANTSFKATCTNLLPYTMTLDATSGVVVGLNYSLLLNTANSGGATTLASTGNGLAQTFFINGNMAAGQAGTCATGSCAGSQARTLMITY
ncbi:MAG: spore coat protein U domain-containing protein [Betaproteobacteria bacterium]